MIELGLENFKGINEFNEVDKCGEGNRPCLLFIGEEFEQKEEYKKFSNILIGMISYSCYNILFLTFKST